MTWFEILKSETGNVEEALRGIINKNFHKSEFIYSEFNELQQFLVNGLVFGENGSGDGRLAAAREMGKQITISRKKNSPSESKYTLGENRLLNGLSLLGFTGYLKRINFYFKAPLEGFKGDKDKFILTASPEGDTKINDPIIAVTGRSVEVKSVYSIIANASIWNFFWVKFQFSIDINEKDKTERFKNTKGTVGKETLDLFFANTNPEIDFMYTIIFKSKIEIEPGQTLAGYNIYDSQLYPGYQTSYEEAPLKAGSVKELILNSVSILESNRSKILLALEKKKFGESDKTTLRDELY